MPNTFSIEMANLTSADIGTIQEILFSHFGGSVTIDTSGIVTITVPDGWTEETARKIVQAVLDQWSMLPKLMSKAETLSKVAEFRESNRAIPADIVPDGSKGPG